MKKALLTALFCLFSFMIFAQQSGKSSQKYVSNAPDGSADVTIVDDFANNILKLKSVNNFYKYQLLDIRTSEPVLSASNRGNACSIDKSRIASGTYNLQLFTQQFIITIEITLSGAKKIIESTALAYN
ncbi:MAG: hypothetical protein R2821_10825 [Flavobacteriaceae bacterium]|nr:hypothetical protein [Flavobacteriaceae bacterium]